MTTSMKIIYSERERESKNPGTGNINLYELRNLGNRSMRELSRSPWELAVCQWRYGEELEGNRVVNCELSKSNTFFSQ